MASQDDEHRLVQAMCRGSEAAYEELFHRYRSRVFTYLRRLVGDHATAEDLLQETFSRVWLARGEQKDPAAFRFWLFRIAQNAARDWSRRRRRRPVADVAVVEPAPGDVAARLVERSDPEKLLLGNELGSRVEEFLASLTVEQREVFLLRMHSQLSFEQIAALTGVGRSTAISRMHYAVNKLRPALLTGKEVEK